MMDIEKKQEQDDYETEENEDSSLSELNPNDY